MRVTSAISSAILIVLASSSALASSSFPGTVQTDLNLSYTPGCTLCHNTPNGGTGTAVQPFAQNMKTQGLIVGDRPSVGMALKGMETAKIDSDKGGVIDVQELKNGTNPNDGADDNMMSNGTPTTTAPAYGCGAAHIAPNPSSEPWMVGGVASLVALLVLRRRRRA